MKSTLRWLLSVIISIVIVFVILSLFFLLARPLKDYLTDYLSGYMEVQPVILTEEEQEAISQREKEQWVTSNALPEQCRFYISGRVTHNDGLPISDAEVKIYNSGLYDSGDYRYTNSNGEFSYMELGTETCDKEQFYVSISKTGFQSYFLLAEPDQVIEVALTSIFYN